MPAEEEDQEEGVRTAEMLLHCAKLSPHFLLELLGVQMRYPGVYEKQDGVTVKSLRVLRAI